MKLKKGISFFGVFSIATGAMISSGIFILPGIAYAQTGPYVFISYFLAGIIALIGILSVIELSTAMPKAGGDYYFINRSLGPMIGTISGFLGWIALSLKSAFAIYGLSSIIFILFKMNPILIKINPLIISAFLCLIFIILNILGVKEAAIFQIIMVVGLLILLTCYIIIGMPKIDFTLFVVKSFSKSSINSIIITSGFIFISFGGLLKIATIAEEVKNPKRNIPLGIITSLVVVTILYTLVVFVFTGTIDPTKVDIAKKTVADSAKIIFGNPGFIAISIASVLAFVTTANAGIMAASRYPLALSRDNLLPKKVSIVNKRFQTPTLSIIITGILIYLSLLLPLELLVKAASTVILTSYVLTNFSVIILRESKLTSYKPSFKTPFYPWIQIVGIIIFSFFIIDLGKAAVEISLAFLFICFCFYIFYGRKKYKGEYAFLHLLKRITDNKLKDNLLENELREILISRDNIEQDNFDNLVKTAEIIDIDESMDFEDLFMTASGYISKKVKMSKKTVFNLLLKRQMDSNTAISQFLAIPHIIIEGKNKMFMLIVRSKEGISFTEEEKNVKAVFIFGGTVEKRVLHLKTLASIATLVQKKEFEKNWINAKNENELRNLILLSNRKRFK